MPTPLLTSNRKIYLSKINIIKRIKIILTPLDETQQNHQNNFTSINWSNKEKFDGI